MALRSRPPVRPRAYLLTFALIASFLILAHGPLLRLPFFWDEAGQFIPAALDLFRAGALIPFSTVPNVHPPGLMACLALVWSVFGFSIETTRIAMLLIAAGGLLAAFLLAIELARGSAGTPAFIALSLLCFSPLFFAQSMLAQLDMPAMCLSLLALLLFLQDRFRASALTCMVLVLVKETGLIAPALFGCWLFHERRAKRRRWEALWFLLPFPGLLIWLLALHRTTGHWLGNAEFEVYNVRSTLDPARFVLALFRRLYYVFIGSGHFIGTAVLIYAWRRLPLLRTRAWRISAAFAAAQIVAVSLTGGAVLERYLLPTLPIFYIAVGLAFEALMPWPRTFALAGLILCLVAAGFINPVYPFPVENNLAFVNFVHLEQDAAAEVALHGPGTIATVFPISDALRNPDLGFVKSGRGVIRLANFSGREIERLKSQAPSMLIYYNQTWDPLKLLSHAPVRKFFSRAFRYVTEMTPEQIAGALSMRRTRRWERQGLSMELLER